MKTISSVAALLVVAAGSMNASAVVPTKAKLTKTHSTVAVAKVTFLNVGLMPVTVQVGENTYRLNGMKPVSVFAPIGSTVVERNDHNSKLDGSTLLTVTAANDLQTISVQ